jgi:hypothetical protein
MTELLTRPPAAAATSTQDAGAARSVWWRGCLAALWAAAVGLAILLVLVLVGWATDGRSGSGAGGAIRFALQLWLLAHKVPLHVAVAHQGGAGTATVAIAPLGLTLGLCFVVARAAAVLARGHEIADVGGAVTVGVAVGVPYAVLAAFTAAAANGGGVRPSALAAMAAGMVVGCGAATWGAARGSGLLTELMDALPWRSGGPVRAGAAGLAVVFVGAMVLDLTALGLHARTAADLANALGGGVVPSLALLLADALLLPNVALATVGYLTGPGFAVGAGTSVSLGGSHVGAVPSLPLLAALPHGAAPLLVRLAAIALLLAAGGLIAWWVTRDAQVSATAVLGRVLAASACAGVLAAALVAVADGPAGPGRMAVVGASPWQVGLALTGELAFVATLVALPLSWPRKPQSSSS